MGARSRRKGAAWEREVARRLTEATGVAHERNLTEVRAGNTGDVWGDLPLSIQCKVGARPPVERAVHEAVAAARPGQHPVAITRRNGAGGRAAVDLATMPLDDWLEIVSLLVKMGVWR